MKVEIHSSYEAVSRRANEIVVSALERHKTLLLCAATGGSPTRTYELLAKEAAARPFLFSGLTVLKLDEWGGLPMDHPATCESYLQKYLIGPLQIPADRYIGFRSDAENPREECARVQQFLEAKGAIDICILGIGLNGHIALNEPNASLQLNCHVAPLTAQSREHRMLTGIARKPASGLTLGMGDIFRSRLVLLLIQGERKREIAQAFMQRKISTELPASLLWLHPNAICLIDEDAAQASD